VALQRCAANPCSLRDLGFHNGPGLENGKKGQPVESPGRSHSESRDKGREGIHGARLAGEFLVASRLAQRGYMVSLQWGNTISYDILAFDKLGRVAFITSEFSPLSARGRAVALHAARVPQ
jgi:hypothetical protein